ncbi:molybdopterin synthase catalytic subunit-like [Musca vetustissima]|uniref:molybdopterin synthase catalytic subunit-like n=1 Tax=Musca vetustissima TaxID=27455 RepID=UPI002AB75015|nr:molybdopterin synthase catalytic subunit-like [Musca vetustissima]
MNYLLLTRDSLDIGSITDLAASDACYTTSLFVGTTRSSLGGKKLISLEFGACESMAEREMENICGELRFRWSDLCNIVIYHRIGPVPIGEANVVIGISSTHTKSSLDAIAVVIDELKKRVPIWRKEKYEGDEFTMCVESTEAETFDEKLCDIQQEHSLPSKFVQISASETEINRRIQSFIERKREEIDINNIVDYINPNYTAEKQNDDEEESSSSSSCARIAGTIIKQENSKCHLKVRQIENKIGPQVRQDYLETLDTLMESDLEPKIKKEKKEIKTTAPIKHALLERTRDIEEHLNLNNTQQKSIHQRLKNIEDRILFLESISPEYCHNLFDKSVNNNNNGNTSISSMENYNAINDPSTKPTSSNARKACRKVYAIDDIDRIIQAELQHI